MDIQIRLTRKENLAHFGKQKDDIVTLDLEREYLPICVASEIYEANSRTPTEAKKAQAVAARTYALVFANNGVVIDDTTNCQAFKWIDPASIPNSARAVSDTIGEVLFHGDGMITAWYSNSNGGRTRRSDEAWKTYKPWTFAQDDPWDIAARAKWGECKASHGVGMSQIGAAYAASIGVGYREILAFYYPGTKIHLLYQRKDLRQNHAPHDKEGTSEVEDPEDSRETNAGFPYGENGAPAVDDLQKANAGFLFGEEGVSDAKDARKTNTGLVEHARRWIGQAYWYGTCCSDCTAGLLNRKKEQYPKYYQDSRMPRYREDIAKRRRCADCVGLIKGYVWDQNGKQVYDKSTDFNTTGLFNRADVKGPVESMPEIPGLIVYKNGHVGVYEGSGSVIEAKGFAYGVIRGRLSDTKWTHWLDCPFIEYDRECGREYDRGSSVRSMENVKPD